MYYYTSASLVSISSAVLLPPQLTWGSNDAAENKAALHVAEAIASPSVNKKK